MKNLLTLSGIKPTTFQLVAHSSFGGPTFIDFNPNTKYDGVPIIIWTCIWQMPALNLSWDTSCLDGGSVVLLSLSNHTGIVS